MAKPNPLKLAVCALGLLFVLQLASAETIITAPLDHRQYRFVTLDNELDVFLVSDPDAKRAAVSLNVAVGSYDDPDDIPGLAHFLEHMLFLGTKKYPDVEEYSKFISEHGGSANAFTKATGTVYFYDIDYNHLEPSLDRFSGFFTAPLFSKKFTDRELNAVNAEHSKNIQNDFRRSYHVLKEMAKPSHPFGRFSTGNRDTLKIHPDLNERMIAFYNTRYSANIMTLALMGRESLDTLEQYARAYFSDVKNTNRARKTYDWQKYEPDMLPAFVQIKPLKIKRTLTLKFYKPGDLDNYKYRAEQFLSLIIGDESENSLFNFLKNKDWITSLASGGFYHDQNGAAGLEIHMDLTETGTGKVHKIVGYFFEYLHAIKTKGLEEWRYDEMKRISDYDYNYAYQPMSPTDLVISLSSDRDLYPVRDVLYHRYRYDGYRPNLIRSFAEYITPENMMIVHTAPNVETDKNEKWYGTEYSVKKIGAEPLKKWHKQIADSPSKFTLPIKNPYISERIAIFEKKTGGALPERIYNEKGLSFYFLQDGEFKQSDSTLFIDAALPDSAKTIKNTVLTKLYALMLSDKLNSILYQARLAQFNVSVGATLRGLSININGYFEQIPTLLKTLLSGLDVTGMSKIRLDANKLKLLESYQNIRFSPANQLAIQEYRHIGSKHARFYKQYADMIPTITLDDFRAYQKHIPDALYLDVFLYGNVRREDAKDIYTALKNNLRYAPVNKDLLPEYQNLKLTSGIDYVKTVRVEDKDSSIMMIFQHPEKTLRNLVINELLLMSLSQAAYNQLRTIEQLGYIVGAYPITHNNTPQSGITVQSPEKTPRFVERRIRLFLDGFLERLTDMPDKALGGQKKILRTRFLEKAKTFYEAANRFNSALSNKDYKMERRALAATLLDTVTKSDLIRYFKETFLSKNNRELIIMAYGKNVPIPKPKKDKHRTYIKDSEQFKQAATYFPHVYFNDLK